MAAIPQKEYLLPKPKQGQSILPNVPLPGHQPDGSERRNRGAKQGIRYISEFKVRVCGYQSKKRSCNFNLKSLDISGGGVLLSTKSADQARLIQAADYFKLCFTINPGSMPEGYDTAVKIKAKLARISKNQHTGHFDCAFEFEKTLEKQLSKTRWRQISAFSAFMLFFIAIFIIFMRAESLIYFNFNRHLYLYSIITATYLLSRYLFGLLYKPVPIDSSFTPGVTIIIPCFNEEEWISRTIISCMNQDYPLNKLEVIVVDDRSTDGSVAEISNTIELIYRSCPILATKGRLSFHVLPQNGGKREAISLGARHAQHNLLVFVDSDSFLDSSAIRNLVQPFKDSKVGGVSGRTDVANIYTNWLTKMQTARYFIAFRIIKAAESYFDVVTCLSGPLSCYRKDLVLANLDDWCNQRFLGQTATFGDDRSMTNKILRNYRTVYQDTAICSTVVPSDQKIFLKQQMRWKRSWLRESIIAGSYIWKKEPFAALFFYMSFVVPFLAPIIFLYNIFYVPLFNQIAPTTFAIGIIMMSLMMSFAYLLFRRSKIWVYGAVFCLYYIGILLWQMPYAWLTFWKSTWGTRMTPADEADLQKKERKASKKRLQSQEEGCS